MTLKKTILTAGATVVILGMSFTGSALANYDGNNNWQDNNHSNNQDSQKDWNKDWKNSDWYNQHRDEMASKKMNEYADAHKNYDQSGNDWGNYDSWWTSRGNNWDSNRNMESDWNDYSNWSHEKNMNWWDTRGNDWEKNDFTNWYNDHMKKGGGDHCQK